MTNARKN